MADLSLATDTDDARDLHQPIGDTGGWPVAVHSKISRRDDDEVVQASAAFVVIQGAFGWFTDNYAHLAEWAASAKRVASLLRALDEVDLSDGPYTG